MFSQAILATILVAMFAQSEARVLPPHPGANARPGTWRPPNWTPPPSEEEKCLNRHEISTRIHAEVIDFYWSDDSPSPSDCARKCLAEPECDGYTYKISRKSQFEDERVCDLFNDGPFNSFQKSRNENGHQTGYISAQKKC
eukprot:Awhi_evm1s7191